MLFVPIDHLDRLQATMLQMPPDVRSQVAAEYIYYRETLRKSENYAAIAAMTKYSNLMAGAY